MDGWERKSRKTQHFCLHKLGDGGVTCEQGVWEGRERSLVCPEPDFEAWMRVVQHPAHESEQRRWWLFHRKYLKPRRQRWLRDCVHNQKGHRSCLGEQWPLQLGGRRRVERSQRRVRSARKVCSASNSHSRAKIDIFVSNRVLPFLGNSHFLSSQTLVEKGEGWFYVLAC